MDSSIDAFLTSWSESFLKVHNGINLLSGFEVNQLGRYHPGNGITFEERITRQKVWLNHFNGLEDLDKAFFKPYWVPVQEDLCNWFVDLSDPGFPVVRGFFFDLEPKGWHKILINCYLSELILSIEKGINGFCLYDREICREVEVYGEQMEKRNSMIINGELPTPSVTIDEVFKDAVPGTLIAPPEEESLILLNALPLSIGLFDPDTDIELLSARCDYRTEVYADDFERITKIRHFMVLMREQGQEHFIDYNFCIVESGEVVWHNEKNELIVLGIADEKRQPILSRIKSLGKGNEQ
jgi:hypothetical protein